MKNPALASLTTALALASAVPADAQIIASDIETPNALSLLDIGRAGLPPVRSQPFSITGRLAKNTDLSLEYKNYTGKYDITPSARARWQISPDAELKWKGILGARLTLHFR